MSTRNPDLPILDELGAEFEAMAQAAYGAEESPAVAEHGAVSVADPDRHTARRRIATTPSGRTRARRTQARRIGRRAAIVLLLVCLVGGVAFAALRGGDFGDHPTRTVPTLLGRAGDGTWSFSAYRDEGRLCTVFVPHGGDLSGSCGAAPGIGRVHAGSAIAGGRRYVFGIAGPGVASVATSIVEGASSSLGRTGRGAPVVVRAPADRGAAAAAGFPKGDDWFVVDLGALGDVVRRAPAGVTPLTRADRRAGPVYVDCSLGVIGSACRRRIEVAAGH